MGRFILIDHSLVDYSGHHYEYAHAVLNAAAGAGFQPMLVANRRFKSELQEPWPILPAYKYGIWLHQGAAAWQLNLVRALNAVRRRAHKFAATEGLAGERGDLPDRRAGAVRSRFEAVRQRRFIRDTANVLKRLAFDEDDLIFWPTVSAAEFDAIGRVLGANRLASRTDWHVLFRRPLDRNDSTASPFDELSPGKSEHAGGLRWHFWTDSEELTAQYRSATGHYFGTLPIPHAPTARAAPPSAERLRILYMGDARLEKGFQHLPRIVRALTDDEPRGRFEFYFQAHAVSPCEDSEIAAARVELTRLAGRGVTLLRTPLSPDKYRELLASGHLVVLPYDERAYSARSSGVFAEALAAGIPALVPDRTWMARRLPAGAGLAYSTISGAPNLIREIATNYERFAEAARRASAAWREEHDARRLVSLLRDRSKMSDSDRRFSEAAINGLPQIAKGRGELPQLLELKR